MPGFRGEIRAASVAGEIYLIIIDGLEKIEFKGGKFTKIVRVSIILVAKCAGEGHVGGGQIIVSCNWRISVRWWRYGAAASF